MMSQSSSQSKFFTPTSFQDNQDNQQNDEVCLNQPSSSEVPKKNMKKSRPSSSNPVVIRRKSATGMRFRNPLPPNFMPSSASINKESLSMSRSTIVPGESAVESPTLAVQNCSLSSDHTEKPREARQPARELSYPASYTINFQGNERKEVLSLTARKVKLP